MTDGRHVRIDHHERVSTKLLNHGLERAGHRLERQAQRADVQDPDGGRQRGERRLWREARGRRRALVEAVAGAAGLVELGQCERRGLVGAHDRVEAHAVGGEQALEPRPEAIGRETAQIGDRLAEPADRAGGVEGGAARMAMEVLVAP